LSTAVQNPLELKNYLLKLFRHAGVGKAYPSDPNPSVKQHLDNIKRKGYFEGACTDFALVFAYLCMRFGFGVPTLTAGYSSSTPRGHAVAVILWDKKAVTGYDVDHIKAYDFIPVFGGSAILASFYFNYKMTPRDDDWRLYYFIEKTNIIPRTGQTLEEARRCA